MHSESQKLKVLALCEELVTARTALAGSFVRDHMVAVEPYTEAKLISPRFYFPWYGCQNWLRAYEGLPSKECVKGLDVHHPLALALPSNFLIILQALSMAIFLLLPLLRLRRAFRYELIHVHNILPAGLLGWLLSRLTRCPLLITCHGADVNIYPRYLHLWWLTCHIAKKADAITAVSLSLQEKLHTWGISKAHFIPNGYNPQLFHIQHEISEPSRAESTKNILFVGQLIPRKGVHDLISAMGHLKSRGIKARALIVGKGFYETNLRHQVELEQLDGKVIFLGEQPHSKIRHFLRTADVLCMPSYQEGWPKVGVEALACGVPIVGTNIGGISEIVQSEEYGVLAPPGNPKELATALEKAFQQTWDRQKLSHHVEQYAWDKIGRLYYEVYQEVITPK